MIFFQSQAINAEPALALVVLIFLLILLLVLAIIAFWIWMIIDCAKRKFKNKNEMIIWLLVIVLSHVLGALIYYIVIKLYNPKGIT